MTLLAFFIVFAKGSSVDLLPPILTAMVAIVTFAGIVRYGRRYLHQEGIKALLDDKDDIIKTNEQSIESLKERIDVLQNQLQKLMTQVMVANEEIQKLKTSLTQATEEKINLGQYVAPVALKDLQKRFYTQEALLKQIDKKLDDSSPT